MASRSATSAGTEILRADTLAGRAINSLVASARRLTGKELTNSTFKRTSGQQWQEDAWEMYDQVGEMRFLATTLGGRVAAGRLYVGRRTKEDPLSDPVPVEDQRLQDVLEAIGDGPVGMQQLVLRLAINLFVAGDGWLVGIPEELMPDYEDANVQEYEPGAEEDLDEGSDVELESLHWRMLSVSEVEFLRDKRVKLLLGERENEQIECSPDDVYLIRVWRPHPRRSWESDSPTRASLPVLRELVGMTMHIGAQVDSRLAGAGVFVVPESAIRAMKRARGIPEDSDEDPFTDALIEAMLKPIEDRANAAALVPLVIVVPDDATGLFQHITFSKPLDVEAKNLREEAIRRYALGADAPPELLLGVANMNHWGGWLVQEDVVNTHTAPPLALIADALTTQYLRPIMLQMGYDQSEVDETMIWYDVSHLIVRPNHGADAQQLHDRGAISDDALREANGFDESDAPGADAGATDKPGPDDAALQALEIVKAMPDLMKDPGLEAVVAQVRNAMYGTPIPATEEQKREEAARRAAGEEPDEDAAQGGTESGETSLDVGGGGGRPGGPSEPAPPAFSLEQLIEAFNAVPGGREYLQGYIRMHGEPLVFSDADGPGRLKDGSPPQCAYCEKTATGWILHSEGMAYVPFCEDHEQEAIDDAEGSTPDGSRDPSNIDRTGLYTGGWGAPSRPKPPAPRTEVLA